MGKSHAQGPTTGAIACFVPEFPKFALSQTVEEIQDSRLHQASFRQVDLGPFYTGLLRGWCDAAFEQRPESHAMSWTRIGLASGALLRLCRHREYAIHMDQSFQAWKFANRALPAVRQAWG